jgi:hypothetical protein
MLSGAYNNIANNKEFLVAETIAYINKTYNPAHLIMI